MFCENASTHTKRVSFASLEKVVQSFDVRRNRPKENLCPTTSRKCNAPSQQCSHFSHRFLDSLPYACGCSRTSSARAPKSDAGLLSIVNQLFYGLTMLIAACIALRKTPSSSANNAIAWTGCVLMTLSTVFLVVNTEIHATWAFATTCILGGIGGAFGGGTWVAAYVRLGVRQAILYGFLSLALKHRSGLALSFMNESSAYVTGVFHAGNLASVLPKGDESASCAQFGKTCLRQRTTQNDGGLSYRVRNFWLVGRPVFPRIPGREPVNMGVSGRIVHQLGVVAIALFIIWWTYIF